MEKFGVVSVKKKSRPLAFIWNKMEKNIENQDILVTFKRHLFNESQKKRLNCILPSPEESANKRVSGRR